MTSPARFGICVFEGLGDFMFLVEISNFLIGADSENRGVPITDVSVMIIQLIGGVGPTRRIALS